MRFFNLYSDILITKGFSRILISDLNRNRSNLYPLELYELISELKNYSIEDVLENYDSDSRRIVHEYLEYLVNKEYGFISEGDWEKGFVSISKSFNTPEIINNIFIELDQLELSDVLCESINNLKIKHIVLLCNNPTSIQEIIQLDRIFENSTIEGIELYSPDSGAIDKHFLQILHEKTKRINRIVIYRAAAEKRFDETDFRFEYVFINHQITINSCGKVRTEDFNTNMSKVLESLNFNSCLYKKIGIDSRGNIKNCPAMPESFGNIHEITLEEALKNKNSTKYWQLTKEEIMICKDCEFRNVCTDCRAYTDRNQFNDAGLDISKPLKCGYDPYSNEWSEWSLNPLKQQAISYYGFENLAVKN